MTTFEEMCGVWKKRIIFLARGRRFLDTETGLHRHGKRSAAALLSGLYPDDPNAERLARSFLDDRLFTTVEAEDYFPGKPFFVTTPKATYANAWRGWNERKGDVTPFTDFCASLFRRSPRDGEKLLDFIAWRAQNGDPHIPFGALLSGPEVDSAKFCSAVEDAFFPHVARIGGPQLRNTSRQWSKAISLATMTAGEQALKSRSTRELLHQFVVAPTETRVCGDRVNLNDPIQNRSFVLMTVPTGKDVDIPADGTFFMVQTEAVPEAKGHALLEFLKNGGGKRVMHFLLKRDLKGFVMPQSAPNTMMSEIIRQERARPFERLAKEMLSSPINRIATWVSESIEWAQAVLDKHANGQTVARATLDRAKHVMAVMPEITIRPWYTSEEIAVMFPDLVTKYPDSLKTSYAIEGVSGYISKELRTGGLQYLVPLDEPRGFEKNGRFQHYFVVSEFEKWMLPITQDEFDAAWKSFPSYRQYVTQLAGEAEAGSVARVG